MSSTFSMITVCWTGRRVSLCGSSWKEREGNPPPRAIEARIFPTARSSRALLEGSASHRASTTLVGDAGRAVGTANVTAEKRMQSAESLSKMHLAASSVLFSGGEIWVKAAVLVQGAMKKIFPPNWMPRDWYL